MPTRPSPWTFALASTLLAACSPSPSTTTDGTGSTTEAATEPTTGDTTGDTDPTGGVAIEPPGEKAGSDKPRNLEPDATDDELATMAEDERDFAVALFNALPPDAKNRAISPTSLRIAVAMAYEGARELTEQEMKGALRFSLDKPRLHTSFNHIELELEKRNLPPSGEAEGDDSVEVAMVNQMFGRLNITWRPEFLDVLAVDYGSSLYKLDFAGAPEVARVDINAWVEGETRGRIPELLPKDSITSAVTGVLVNALYLKAPWQRPFDSVSEGETFTRADGVEVEVAMMDGAIQGAGYYKGDGVEAVEIPLRGYQLTMVLIVPDAGSFGAYVDGLDGAALGDVLAGLASQPVQVALPRFGFATDLGLKATLQALGMKEAFKLGEADFSGLADTKMAVADVYHDTFVAVDEKGVEAAAASAVVLFDTGSGEEFPQVQLRADRPFLFAIRDRGTDALLFLGRVLDPTAS